MSSFELQPTHKFTHLLFYAYIIATTSSAPIFGNDGLCCRSPSECGISDCGVDSVDCCRLNDDYLCDPDSSLSQNIYEGSFIIPMNNNNTNEALVYFRIYPNYIHFECTLSSNDSAIGITWSDYNHPIPNLHLSIFASDINANDKWSMVDILAQRDTFDTYNGQQAIEHTCESKSGYCLPQRKKWFNYETAYNLFNFVCVYTLLQSSETKKRFRILDTHSCRGSICVCLGKKAVFGWNDGCFL